MKSDEMELADAICFIATKARCEAAGNYRAEPDGLYEKACRIVTAESPGQND